MTFRSGNSTGATNDDILAKLDAPAAEAFRAETEGDMIAGTVIALGHWDAGYGDYPIVTVDPSIKLVLGGRTVKARDPLAVHGLGTVLAEKLEPARVGDRIAVRYDGERTSKSKNVYKAWSVAIEPGTVADRLPPARQEEEEPF